MKNDREIIIFKHGGGELANQLWNYLCIYAYGLHSKSPVANPSFYEYHSYFNLVQSHGLPTRLLSSLGLGIKARRNSFTRQLWRRIYAIYSRTIEIICKKTIVSSENLSGSVFYLPPTVDLPEDCRQKKIYFKGWLFRNPIGLAMYRENLLTAFAPKQDILQRVNEIVSPLKTLFSHMVGIHIRQGDYAIFKDGRYRIGEKRVREVIDEYIEFAAISPDTTVFIITSDGKVNPENYKGLNIYISNENPITDLFLLSSTSIILGSDSSFGAFAAWYGNIPHIIFKNEHIDWTYYKEYIQKGFFNNKYCTLLKL
jgi:hypothetical protein